MGDINIKDSVAITINGNDIEDKVLRYSRDQQICTGIGTLSITMVDDGTDYDPWDVIVLYEDGHKKGKYFATTVKKDANSGTITIEAQDTSKKLADYFIDQSYTITEYSTNTYWLSFFFGEVGVDYNFLVSTATPLSENTSLGFSSAYDTIVQLLQYSGLFMYFDPDGTAIIGSMRLGGGSANLTDSRILSIKRSTHDGMLRNRAVVWGNADPTTGEWIFADLSVNTPWNYDARDQRAVVLSNHNIRTTEDAYGLARMMLNTFSSANKETTVEVEGFVNVHVGSRVSASTEYIRATGTVTTLTVEVSDRGAITTLVLDEKCPRLFAWWDEPIPEEDYVYVGTDGSGVWRKTLAGTTWEDFSSGLPSGEGGTFVEDLYINDDIFACVDSAGSAYYRYISSSWSALVPSGVMNATTSGIVETNDLLAQACTINHLSNDIIVGYNSGNLYSGGWVVTYSGGNGGLANAAQVYIPASGSITEPIYDLAVFDVDTADLCNIISVATLSGYTETIIVPDDLGGWRTGELETFATRNNRYGAVTIPRQDGRTFTYFDLDDWYYPTYSYKLDDASNPVISYLTVHEGLESTYLYTLQTNTIDAFPEFTATRYKLKGDGTEIPAWSGDSVSGTSYEFGTYPIGMYKTSNEYYRVYAGWGWSSVGQISGGSYVLDFNDETSTLVGQFDINKTGDMRNLATLMHYKYIWVLYDINHQWPSNFSDTYGILRYDVTTGEGEEFELGVFEWGDDYRYGSDFEWALYPNGEDDVIIIGTYIRQRPTLLTVVPDEIGYMYGTSAGLSRRVLFNGDQEGYSLDDQNIGLSHEESSVWLGEDIISSSVAIKMSWEQRYNETPLEFIPHTLYVYVSNTGVSEVWDTVTYTGIATSSKYTEAVYTVWYDSPNTTLQFIDKLTGQLAMERNVSELITYDPPYRLLYSPLDDLYDTVYLVGTNDRHAQCFSINNFYQGKLGNFPSPIYYYYGTLSNLFLVYSDVTPGCGSSLEWYFLVPTHIETFERELTTRTGYLLRQENDTFTTIYSGGSLYLDISNQAPLEAYTITSGTPLGTSTTEYVRQSFLMQPDTFSDIDTLYALYDIRTVRFVSSGLVPASGTMDSFDGQYVVAASYEAVKGFPTSLSGASITVASLSGLVSHIETSRFLPDPYLFVSLSGDSDSGSSFLQRNPGDALSSFTDFTYNFPSGSYITTIRLDDRM